VALTAQTSAYLNGTVDVSNAQSTGGNILLTTNKLEGMVGGVLRADGKQGGHIRIESNVWFFSSTLAATGSTQGGTIEVTGDRVSAQYRHRCFRRYARRYRALGWRLAG
jgi:hypothetical protein